MYDAWRQVSDDVRPLPAFKELLIDFGLVESWRVADCRHVCRLTGTKFECA